MQNLFSRAYSYFISFIKREDTDGRPHPLRDWLIILSAALVFFIGAALFGAYLAYRAGYGYSAPETKSVDSDSTLLDTAVLENVEELFSERAAEREKYRSGVYRFPDPSR